MRMKLTYDDNIVLPAGEFAQSVTGWFDLLEHLPNKPWAEEEMIRIMPVLTGLYTKALNLPHVRDFEREELDEREKRKMVMKYKCNFAEGMHEYYALFYLFEVTGGGYGQADVPVIGTFEDDIYDISLDLQEGYSYFERGMIYRAVFIWRLLFLSHWGEHASQALYAMDHAVRGYLSDLDMGKYDDPADDMYYPVVKDSDIDGFFVLRLQKKETKLPYEIVIDSLGMLEDDIPMIGVVVGDSVVFISVSEEPMNLSRQPFPDEDRVYEWVIWHQGLLTRHWNKEISDKELAEGIADELDMRVNSLPFD